MKNVLGKYIIAQILVMGFSFYADAASPLFQVFCSIRENPIGKITQSEDLTNKPGVAGAIKEFTLSDNRVVQVYLYSVENADDASTFDIQTWVKVRGAKKSIVDLTIRGVKPQPSKYNNLVLSVTGIGDLRCQY